MNDDRLIQLLAEANPVDEEARPSPGSAQAETLLAEILAEPRRRRSLPTRIGRRRVAVAVLVLLLAGAGALASPIGQGAVGSVLEQVRSLFGGEGAVVDDEGTVRRFDADGIVTSAVPDGRGGWFLAGGFTRVNGEPRAHLAHLLGDGSLDPAWTPELGGGALAHYAWAKLALADGRLYVAGTFATVNGKHRGQVLALDPETGELAAGWRVFVNTRGSAISAVLVQDGRLWLGLQGSAVIEGQVVRCVAALDGRTGALDRRFTPSLEAVGGLPCVDALAVAGERLYVGGTFTAADGTPRPGLAVLDSDTARLTESFDPPATRCRVCSIHTLALAGDRLYVGGSAAEQADRSLIALDALTGSPLDFAVTISGLTITDPGQAPGHVFNLAVLGDELYVGGSFREVNGQPRNGFAVLDHKGNLQESWQPSSTTEYILAVATSGRDVLAAGAGARSP